DAQHQIKKDGARIESPFRFQTALPDGALCQPRGTQGTRFDLLQASPAGLVYFLTGKCVHAMTPRIRGVIAKDQAGQLDDTLVVAGTKGVVLPQRKAGGGRIGAPTGATLADTQDTVTASRDFEL